MNDELRDQLHRTADEIDFAVPDLRPRAKAARTRRRLAAVGAVAATLVLAAAVIVPLNLGNQKAVPAEPTTPETTPSPSASHTAPNVVPDPSTGPGSGIPHAEIIDRCRSQLAPSIKAFGPIPDDLRVARNRDYKEGDVVRLVSDSGWDPSALCIVPSADATTVVNVHDTLEAALRDSIDIDDGLLLEVCSELDTNTWAAGVPEYNYATTDLRPGSVLSHITEDGLHHALIDLDDDRRLECGWEFRPDATIDAFAVGKGATGFESEVPFMGLEPVRSSWDGVSEYGRIVAWGMISPELHAEDIITWGGIDTTIVYSPLLGIYQLITHVIPEGTADEWTATAPPYMESDDEFKLTVLARDKRGNELLSVNLLTSGPVPSKAR